MIKGRIDRKQKKQAIFNTNRLYNQNEKLIITESTWAWTVLIASHIIIGN